jgi:pimeloyl-ACP methyl ester carboxylesterase
MGKEREASSASNGIQRINAQYRQKMRRTRRLSRNCLDFFANNKAEIPSPNNSPCKQVLLSCSGARKGGSDLHARPGSVSSTEHHLKFFNVPLVMKTIVFVHGMFLNPKSWSSWVSYFEERGYRCIAPAWPLHEGEPSALRARPPAGLGTLSLDTIVEHIASIVSELPERPIVIGHSVGGLIVQLLAARGLIEAGVPISSVAPNKMLAFDWGFFKNSASITNPLKGDEYFPMSAESFHASFANTMSEAASNLAYEQYATHDSRNVLRDCMGPSGEIDLKQPHAPLLFIAGEEDQIIPAKLNRKNAEAYTDEASETDFVVFPHRGHFICTQNGWQEVADRVAEWIDEVAEPTPKSVDITDYPDE